MQQFKSNLSSCCVSSLSDCTNPHCCPITSTLWAFNYALANEIVQNGVWKVNRLCNRLLYQEAFSAQHNLPLQYLRWLVWSFKQCCALSLSECHNIIENYRGNLKIKTLHYI